MRFNAKKCYILSVRNKSQHCYSLDDTILQRVSSNPYLAVEFSEDLRWSTHISKISKTSSSTPGFLCRNVKIVPHHVNFNAYLSLVRSAVEYGTTVWDPYLLQDIDRLDRVQRRGAGFITGDYKSRSPGCVTQMLVQHNLLSLQERRKHLRLAFLFKVVKGSVLAIPPEYYLIPQRPKHAVRVRTFKDQSPATSLILRLPTTADVFGTSIEERAIYTFILCEDYH